MATAARHELEADGLGAEYMHKIRLRHRCALLEVIGVLKDQEQYQRVKCEIRRQDARPPTTASTPPTRATTSD